MNRVTSDAGLRAYRKLDDGLCLTAMAGDIIADDTAGEAHQEWSEDCASGRYVTFQLAEAAILKTLFADILRRIDRRGPKLLPT